jgi:ribokinase
VAGVVVVGSANVDLNLAVQRIPGPGETVLATALTRGPGGKGANQAVAAARAGAATAFVACLGRDDSARLLRDALTEAGVSLDLLTTTDTPTGTAVITVDQAGENAITVAPSANTELVLTPCGPRPPSAGRRRAGPAGDPSTIPCAWPPGRAGTSS